MDGAASNFIACCKVVSEGCWTAGIGSPTSPAVHRSCIIVTSFSQTNATSGSFSAANSSAKICLGQSRHFFHPFLLMQSLLPPSQSQQLHFFGIAFIFLSSLCLLPPQLFLHFSPTHHDCNPTWHKNSVLSFCTIKLAEVRFKRSSNGLFILIILAFSFLVQPPFLGCQPQPLPCIGRCLLWWSR